LARTREGLEKSVWAKQIASISVNGIAGAITPEAMAPGAKMLPVLFSLDQFFGREVYEALGAK